MKVFITGINGQLGSYLAELYLENGHSVVGMVRRSSTNTLDRVKHIKDRIEIVEGDMTDCVSISSLVQKYKPDAICNTAAMSHVHTSFEQPEYTFNVNTNGVLYFLESIKKYSKHTRFITFSTSEQFGNNFDIDLNGNKYQDELTVFSPQSPYAVSKVAAHQLVGLYRKAYGLHASCAINFNSESPRRGEEFVTRKITKWIGEFSAWIRNKNGSQIGFSKNNIYYYNYEPSSAHNFPYSKFPKLRLGNLDTYRDWSHAKDTVRGIYLMSLQETPDDYVFCSESTHSIREFLSYSFSFSYPIAMKSGWEKYVVQDPKFYRPAEVDYLCGRSKKARDKLGWKPVISFNELVKEMVDNDVKPARTK